MKRLKIDEETIKKESIKLYEFIKDTINNAEINSGTTDEDSKKEIIRCALRMMILSMSLVTSKTGKHNMSKTFESYNKNLDLMKVKVPKKPDKVQQAPKKLEEITPKELIKFMKESDRFEIIGF